MKACTNRKIHSYVAIAFAFACLSGCGNFKTGTANSSSLTSIAGIDPTPVGPAPTPSLSPSSSPSVPTGTQALYSFRVGATGYNSTSVTVNARIVVRVRFTPNTQDELVAGSGYAPQYSGLGVYLNVGSLTQPTPFLHNGYQGTSVENAVIDLSSGIQKVCPDSDTACRQNVVITVSKPNYDWYCLNGYFYGCPWAHVYDTHPWHGTLEVQTDDTVALPQ